MAQNITLLGASYSNVPAVELPKTGGGTASFTDVTDTTAAASDVASGKYFFTANGVLTLGTNQGGSGDGYVWQDGSGYVHLSDEEGTQPIYDTLNVSSSGTFTPATGHAYNSVVVPSGTEGTPTATKGTVSSHSIAVTPSVTNTAGYISGGTKTGTTVSVSASELVSGNLPITQNGNNIDCANYSTVSVNVSGGGGTNAPTFTITFNDSWETIISTTCDKTFAEVSSLINDGVEYAIVVMTDQSGTEEYELAATLQSSGGSSVIYYLGAPFPEYEITLSSNNTATTVAANNLIPLSVTSNGTYTPTYGQAYNSVTVNVSGGSSYTLIASTSYQVNTTSTTAVSVGTFETEDTSIWTSNKMVFVKIRDSAGRRNGYFYGSDSIICNNAPGNNLSSTSNYLIYGTMYYQNTAGNLINMNLQRTRSSYQIEGYGVYPRLIYDDGSIDIFARYSSSSYITTQTINGTFNVEVYLLEWPDNINPFIG